MSNSNKVELNLKSGKKITVNCKVTFGAMKEYEKLKKEGVSDYKLLMCRIIYSLIGPEDRENISINDISQVDNNTLKELGEQIILNTSHLKEYFEADKEFFEGFTHALDLYLDKARQDMILAVKPAVESLGRLINSANKIGESFGEINTLLVSGIKEAIKPIEVFKERFANILQGYNEVFQSFYEFGNMANKFVIIMLELDYPPINLYYEEMKGLVNCYEQFGIDRVKSNIESVIISHYDNETLKDMLFEWKNKERLDRRTKILEDVIQAYIEGKYNLVVPTLLAQIEGTIAEGFSHQGNMTGKTLNSYIDQLLNDDVQYLSGSIDSMAKKFISQVVLVRFMHGQDIPSSLSRHAILHGADTLYGTQINALKAILLFDYIQETIEREKVA